MNDVVSNLALACRYQRRALEALIPEPVVRHGAAIERELRALAIELLDADRAATASGPETEGTPKPGRRAQASTASTTIKVN